MIEYPKSLSAAQQAAGAEVRSMDDARRPDVLVIGAAVADILLRPVDEGVFARSSTEAEEIRMNTGGDAMNEATVLARLGHVPVLVTVLGRDRAADFLAAHCRTEGIILRSSVHAGEPTGINAVLVRPDGERFFVTAKGATLRTLGLRDAMQAFACPEFPSVRAVCLASMFVSHALDLRDTAALFRAARDAGKLVCADTTTAKRGETVRDAAEALSLLDVFFANAPEARLLTGRKDPAGAAAALEDAGARTVAVKTGAGGCLIRSGGAALRIPAWTEGQCVDTTGAGDSFAAAFIAGRLEGRSDAECGALANAAASMTVEVLGATAARYERGEIERRAQKLLSLAERA